MKKIIVLITLFLSAKNFAYTYDFQNSTPYMVTLKVQFEKGCKETSFDIEANKIHPLKDQACDIKSINGVVYMEGKKSESGTVIAKAYIAREAKKRDNTWAIYGPLYSGNQDNIAKRNDESNKIIEAKTASFSIARLIE